MFYVRDHKTLNMFDPLERFGPKRRLLMEKSWATLFRDTVLPHLPVNELFPFFDEYRGRPTKELFAMVGLLIIQQMRDLTDEEAVEQFAFNAQWHFALGIDSDSDRDAYVSPRTLWGMRNLFVEGGLDVKLFNLLADHLAKVFSVDTSKQRLDSTHIFSNMRHLGRIGIFVATIKKFLVNLKRHHQELFSSLNGDLVDRYTTKQGESSFSMVKPSESAKTLEEVANDLFGLVNRFKDDTAVADMSSYRLLVRVLKEQCVVTDPEDAGKGGPRVQVKPNKEVSSGSLQNPSDPDAGYDAHKGKGYQAQIMETCTPEGEDKQLSLLVHVEVEPAHKSDAGALIPAIEDAGKRQIGPSEVLADTAYGGDDNCEKARALGVEVVAPAPGSLPKGGLMLSEFTFTDEGVVTACPEGRCPIRTKEGKNGRIARFGMDDCRECPRLADCPVQEGKRGFSVRYSAKDLRLSRRRAAERTEAFRNRYRNRAGVEATMSQCKAKTGLGRLRVRGLPRVRFCAVMKAAAINILRATAFRNAKKNEKALVKGARKTLSARYFVLKEPAARSWGAATSGLWLTLGLAPRFG